MAERTLTLKQLAAALGIAENNLLPHIRRGMPSSQTGPKGGKAFNADECRAWLAKNLNPSGGGGASKMNAIAQERAGIDLSDDEELGSALEVDLKLKAVRTREIELRLAVKEGKLVDAEKVEREITSHLTQARQAFEAVPIKAAAKIVGLLAVDHERQNDIADAIAAEIADAVLVLSTR